MFLPRWFVSLRVCLSVTTITKKLWTALDQISWEGSYGKGKIEFVFRYDR